MEGELLLKGNRAFRVSWEAGAGWTGPDTPYLHSQNSMFFLAVGLRWPAQTVSSASPVLGELVIFTLPNLVQQCSDTLL